MESVYAKKKRWGKKGKGKRKKSKSPISSKRWDISRRNTPEYFKTGSKGGYGPSSRTPSPNKKHALYKKKKSAVPFSPNLHSRTSSRSRKFNTSPFRTPCKNSTTPRKRRKTPSYRKKLKNQELFKTRPMDIYSPEHEEPYHQNERMDSSPIYAPNRSPFPFDDGSILVSPYFNKNAHSPSHRRVQTAFNDLEQEEKDLFGKGGLSTPPTCHNFVNAFFNIISKTLSTLIPAIMYKLQASEHQIANSKDIIADLVLGKFRKLFQALFVGQFQTFRQELYANTEDSELRDSDEDKRFYEGLKLKLDLLREEFSMELLNELDKVERMREIGRLILGH